VHTRRRRATSALLAAAAIASAVTVATAAPPPAPVRADTAGGTAQFDLVVAPRDGRAGPLAVGISSTAIDGLVHAEELPSSPGTVSYTVIHREDPGADPWGPYERAVPDVAAAGALAADLRTYGSAKVVVVNAMQLAPAVKAWPGWRESLGIDPRWHWDYALTIPGGGTAPPAWQKDVDTGHHLSGTLVPDRHGLYRPVHFAHPAVSTGFDGTAALDARHQAWRASISGRVAWDPPPAGESGVQMLVLDGVTLTARYRFRAYTNIDGIAYGPDDYGRDLWGTHRPAMTDLLLLRTYGPDPLPTPDVRRWLADFVARMGGTPELVLGATTGYSMVAVRPDAPHAVPPLETSSARDAGSDGTLGGLLEHSWFNGAYVPSSGMPLAGARATLLDGLLTMAGALDTPFVGGPAYDRLVAATGGQDVRRLYTNLNVPETDLAAKRAQLRAWTPPADCPLCAGTRDTVVLEIDDAIRVRQLLHNVSRDMADLGGYVSIAATDVSRTVQAAYDAALRRSQSLAANAAFIALKFIGELFVDVVKELVPAAPKLALSVVSASWKFGTNMAIYGDSWRTRELPGERLRTTVAQLPAVLDEQFQTAAHTMRLLFARILGDGHMLRELGGRLLAAQTDPSSPWYYSPSEASTVRVHGERAIRQVAFQTLLPVGFEVIAGHDLRNTVPTERGEPVTDTPNPRWIWGEGACMTIAGNRCFDREPAFGRYVGDQFTKSWTTSRMRAGTFRTAAISVAPAYALHDPDGANDDVEGPPPNALMEAMEDAGVYLPHVFHQWALPRIHCDADTPDSARWNNEFVSGQTYQDNPAACWFDVNTGRAPWRGMPG